MKKFVVILLVVLFSLVQVSYAHDGGNLSHKGKYLRAKVERTFGERTAGRDIIRNNLRGGVKPSKHQKAKYVRQLRKFLQPAPYYPLLQTKAILPKQPPASILTSGYAAGGTLQAIANCESGGNPNAVSKNGIYRGKYQFDYGTWIGVGGTGDPAAASEAEQDKRAAMLYSQRGAAPWPVCGR